MTKPESKPRDIGGDSFAALGHDLLQPLLAARLCLAALADMETKDRAQKLLAQIDQSLSAVEEQLIGALEVAKLESGATVPIPTPIILGPLFKAMQTSLLPLALQKGIELTHVGTRFAVMTDPRLLRRILQNLVANAIRYTERGRVRVIARAKNDLIRIEIWDSGPGIEEADRAILFDAFRRGKSNNDGVDGGQGLGLAIVRRLAARLDHKVGFYTHPGRGSCFWISVPAAPDLAVAEIPKGVLPASLGLVGTRVLIIEPDSAARSALRLLFTSWSCDAIAFASVAEFERHHTKAPFPADLVLADLNLVLGPDDPDGLHRLRKSIGKSPPAIVFHSDDQGETAERAEAADARILATPIRPSALRALMTHLLK